MGSPQQQTALGVVAAVGSVGRLVVAQLHPLFFFLGQMGFGANAVGQAVGVGRDYMKEMNREFTELLSFRSTRGLPGAE